MHYYTSITTNYLPKARVLAESVKRHDPQAVFHLLLTDVAPEGWDLSSEPFDTVLHLDDLPIKGAKAWAFKHALVEMCTAVKGVGALEIVRRHRPDKLVYFDPDIVVFGGLQDLARELDHHSVLLTPHLTDPEQTPAGVLDNEISALKHGIYNLGFVGWACHGEGLRCMQWWAARLLEHCRDDIAAGLFTDQRWADHMPGMFGGVKVLREPVYNVATWNLSTRTATGTVPDGILINGQPLAFYHFSGLDSGAQETMLGLYGRSSPVLFELRRWYLQECDRKGQQTLGRVACVYSTYANGQPITRAQRITYRERQDLQAAFADPFDTADVNRSYWHWYEANAANEMSLATNGAGVANEALLRQELSAAQSELSAIKRSRSWKVARILARAASLWRPDRPSR